MLNFIWKNIAAFQQWRASISADVNKQLFTQKEVARQAVVAKKEEISFRTGESIRLQKALLDIRAQEESYQAKLQSDIVKLTTDLNFKSRVVEELNQRFEDASPFLLPVGQVWAMLLKEYEETPLPLILIAPFWDESQVNSTNDAGGQQFRVAVADALRDTPWSDDFNILDGYFKRPLRQTDMDLRIINDVLKELPVCIIYGTLDQHEVRVEIALWNILPGEIPGHRVYIRGKGRMPRDEVIKDNREFTRALGYDLANEIGQIGAIYHLFNTKRPIEANLFLTGDFSRDIEIKKRFLEYQHIFQLAAGEDQLITLHSEEIERCKERKGLTLRLRKEAKIISVEEVKAMIKKLGFYDKNWNLHGRPPMEFEDEGDTVINCTTELMWQKGGSEFLTYDNAKRYIEQLNEDYFGGFSDWRLPTIEEAASLLHSPDVPSIFEHKQHWIWTADKRSPDVAWTANFGGFVRWDNISDILYVRACRNLED